MTTFAERLIRGESQRHHDRLLEITSLMPQIRALEPVITELEKRLVQKISVMGAVRAHLRAKYKTAVHLELDIPSYKDQSLYRALINLGFQHVDNAFVSREINWEVSILEKDGHVVEVSCAPLYTRGHRIPTPTPARRASDQVAA